RSLFAFSYSASLTFSSRSTVLPLSCSTNAIVRHRRGRGRAVPVFLAGRARHDVAGPVDFDCSSQTLHQTTSGNDDERLAEGMRMPRSAPVRFEFHADAEAAWRFGRLKERIDAYGPGERFDRRFHRRC